MICRSRFTYDMVYVEVHYFPYSIPRGMQALPDGWTDQTQAYWESCGQIRPEYFVHDEGYALLYLMNAIEVMDPIMDAGMACPIDMIPEKERVPRNYASFPSLSCHDVCWVLDRFIACELEWLHGATLVQTIYTSPFFHEHVLAGKPTSEHWSHTVLVAYIFATVKGCAIQWNELAKQLVLDQEDYCSDTGGIAFPDAHSVSSIITQLQLAAVKAKQHLDEEEASSLSMRLSFRKHWLLCLSAMAADVPDSMDVHIHLESCMQLWVAISTSKYPLLDSAMRDAPQHLHTFFDVALSRTLSSHIPMRPLSPPDRQQVLDGWHRILFKEMPIPLRLLASSDVLAWKSLLECTAMTFQRYQAPVPLVRSFIQTMVANGYTVMGGTHDTEYLAVNLIETWQNICVQNIVVRLEWYQHRQPTSVLATMLSQFLQRLGSSIAQTLRIFAQNRSRQRRSFSKAYASWMDLLDLADTLTARINDIVSIPSDVFTGPVLYMILVHMEHAIGCGFELELYHAEERACMYWLLALVYGEQYALTKDHPSSTWQCIAHASRAQQHLCSALAMLRVHTYGSKISRAQTAFARRLKWLRRPSWSSQPRLSIVTSSVPFDVNMYWKSYDSWHQMTLLQPIHGPVLEHLDESIFHARQVLEARVSDASAILCRRERRTLDQHVLDAAVALGAWVRTHPSQRPVESLWTNTHHPWYDTLLPLLLDNKTHRSL